MQSYSSQVPGAEMVHFKTILEIAAHYFEVRIVIKRIPEIFRTVTHNTDAFLPKAK